MFNRGSPLRTAGPTGRLLVQLQGQAVRVVEKGKAPLGVSVPADGLTFDSLGLQLEHGNLDVVHPEGQVAQALG